MRHNILGMAVLFSLAAAGWAQDIRVSGLPTVQELLSKEALFPETSPSNLRIYDPQQPSVRWAWALVMSSEFKVDQEYKEPRTYTFRALEKISLGPEIMAFIVERTYGNLTDGGRAILLRLVNKTKRADAGSHVLYDAGWEPRDGMGDGPYEAILQSTPKETRLFTRFWKYVENPRDDSDGTFFWKCEQLGGDFRWTDCPVKAESFDGMVDGFHKLRDKTVQQRIRELKEQINQKRNDNQAWNDLVGYLKNPHNGIRREAASAFRGIFPPPDTLMASYAEALRDPDNEVRGTLLVSMRKKPVPSEVVINAVRSLADDKSDYSNQKVARELLAEWGK